ncbi:unnamed protein product [Rhizophagus irregularis]|nr:unnamed protein product [Rhizophagus irregularis]
MDDKMDFFVLFDGQPICTKLVATPFITILNDTLKCLAEYASNIPLIILDTLQFIFGIEYHEIDINGNPNILFRAHDKDEKDKNWVRGLTKILNNLINYKKYSISPKHYSKYWPIAVSLLAFLCTFYYLEKNYAQVEYNIVTNDQVDMFKKHNSQLREILDKIYMNLEEKQTEDFIVNIGILQGHRENFVPFLKEINDSLKAQLKEINNKKDNEMFKVTGSAICTLCSIVATANLDPNSLVQKIVGSISGGVLGAITIHKFLNIRILKKIIDEHNEFLNGVQNYVDDVKLTDSEIPIILYQFKTYHDKVDEFQTKIAKLKKQ